MTWVTRGSHYIILNSSSRRCRFLLLVGSVSGTVTSPSLLHCRHFSLFLMLLLFRSTREAIDASSSSGSLRGRAIYLPPAVAANWPCCLDIFFRNKTRGAIPGVCKRQLIRNNKTISRNRGTREIYSLGSLLHCK